MTCHQQTPGQIASHRFVHTSTAKPIHLCTVAHTPNIFMAKHVSSAAKAMSRHHPYRDCTQRLPVLCSAEEWVVSSNSLQRKPRSVKTMTLTTPSDVLLAAKEIASLKLLASESSSLCSVLHKSWLTTTEQGMLACLSFR